MKKSSNQGPWPRHNSCQLASASPLKAIFCKNKFPHIGTMQDAARSKLQVVLSLRSLDLRRRYELSKNWGITDVFLLWKLILYLHYKLGIFTHSRNAN